MTYLFVYLEFVGVWGVAVIKEVTPTSEGVDYIYEFMYKGVYYNGGFTGLGGRQIGDKYFVLFSLDNPDKSLLQYNSPVPDCFRDSINMYWNKMPKCP